MSIKFSAQRFGVLQTGTGQNCNAFSTLCLTRPDFYTIGLSVHCIYIQLANVTYQIWLNEVGRKFHQWQAGRPTDSFVKRDWSTWKLHLCNELCLNKGKCTDMPLKRPGIWEHQRNVKIKMEIFWFWATSSSRQCKCDLFIAMKRILLPREYLFYHGQQHNEIALSWRT